ncbi:MAG: hypothetical protein GY864_11925 [Desulfobacterales bacterium]|nr:hypothetical protein [Desulfobacterales bacterium]
MFGPKALRSASSYIYLGLWRILVIHAINKAPGPFRIAELQNACPNVSVDMIRRVLKNLLAKDQVKCVGRGQNARWRKTRHWALGNTPMNWVTM